MADEERNVPRDTSIDGNRMEIKVEPGIQCYVEEEHENGVGAFDGSNTVVRSDVGALNLWTSKATTCLISQYKKYRSMVGQSTQIRSLREMFEMISLEMRNYGFYFSPQKCENKWRVLERKYKNLVFRERLKKPGRMRHYGHWEHKRALDEIFNEKKRRMYLEEGDFPLQTATTEYAMMVPKSTSEEQQSGGSNCGSRQVDHLASFQANAATNKQKDESLLSKGSLSTLFEKFLEEMGKNFDLAERNKERRHKEKMAMKQNELEVKRCLLKLEEEKMELQKCQMVAAAQQLRLNMK